MVETIESVIKFSLHSPELEFAASLRQNLTQFMISDTDTSFHHLQVTYLYYVAHAVKWLITFIKLLGRDRNPSEGIINLILRAK